MSDNARLIELLKAKGTGATMGKHLSTADLAELPALLQSPNCNLTTKATLVCAILMLEPTAEEAAFIPSLRNYLSSDLETCFYAPAHPLEQLNQHLMAYNDLSELEIRTGLGYVFDDDTPDYMKAVFQEALRLKRETHVENMTTYNVLLEKTKRIDVDIPILIDLSNPYDGFKRHSNQILDIAKRLAKAGCPTIIHGVESMGPKFGVTVHQLLKEAGENPLKSLDEVKANLENPDIGWAYVDQSIFCPELFKLRQLRIDMVKRPVLATVEKLLQPVRAHKNRLVTGYTHPPYKDKMAKLITQSKLFDDTLIFRGVEGSMQLPEDKRARLIRLQHGSQDADTFVSLESHSYEALLCSGET